MQSSTEDTAAELILEVAHEEDTVEIQDDLQWIKRVTKELNESQEKKEGRWPCTIFMVPEDIRQCDTKAYDPLVITIGPYHYGKSKDRTVLAMQDHKWHCVRRLLSRHTKSKRKATDLLGKCLMIMKEMDADIRSCYSENLHHLTAHDLALIMLLDGCFIIHVLLNTNEEGYIFNEMIMLNENNDEEEEIAAGHEEDMVVLDVKGEKQMDLRVAGLWRVWAMMLDDLVKLENQIPFIIIQTLFNELKTPGDKDINLVEIAHELLSHVHPSDSKYFNTNILPHDLPESNQVHHLLHLLHSTIVPSSDCLEINSTEQEMDSEWIPSATKLQLAGIKFVEKTTFGSSLDISFSKGTIEIPKLLLVEDTNTFFRNLIAFEQCYPHTSNCITAYAIFMAYMISTPEDVELFELKGILVNNMGTADAAVSLINQWCHLIYNPSGSYLRGSILFVENYYKSRWNQWRARLMSDYFGNPWAIVSLVAALILLLLTVQQSFFAAYSYFHPTD